MRYLLETNHKSIPTKNLSQKGNTKPSKAFILLYKNIHSSI